MNNVIVALGSVNADFQMRIEQPLGTGEMAMAHDFRRLGGGKAANVAFLARRLGHDAWLLGRVGNDDLGQQALAPMRAARVDVSGVSRATGDITGVAMVFVPPSGKKRIVLAANANDRWNDGARADACRRIETAPAGSVLVVDCEVPVQVVKSAVAAAKRRGLRVVLDPSFPERVDAALLAQVDAITPNESEARALRHLSGAQDDDPDALAHGLAAHGPRVVCVKLDNGGCLLLLENRAVRIAPAAAEVEVADTTGAGDAFTGAFATAWLEGQTTETAARFAVAASTLAVTRYGAQPSYAGRDAIEAQLRRLDPGPRA